MKNIWLIFGISGDGSCKARNSQRDRHPDADELSHLGQQRSLTLDQSVGSKAWFEGKRSCIDFATSRTTSCVASKVNLTVMLLGKVALVDRKSDCKE